MSASSHASNPTICAISTPAGVGGIAVIRISGAKAIETADSIWQGKRLTTVASHTVHLGYITDPSAPDEPLDQAVATIFRAPASFTGEDVVELSVHGSSYIQQQLINLLIRQGCSLAQPGEFSRRAFASGKLDLAEAEAVADLIASSSKASHRLAMNQMRGHFSERLALLREELLQLAALMELELDFSEEEVEFADRTRLHTLAASTQKEISRLCDTFSTGDAIRNGIPVAIVGSPNAGKSSLLNTLLSDNRAIVSDIPGTTRDTIEDTAQINGVNFRFTDTAGIRTTADTIETLGIERAWDKISQARIIIWLTTPGEPITTLQTYAERLQATRHSSSTLLLAVNKTDLLPDYSLTQVLPDHDHLHAVLQPDAILPISVTAGTGIDTLRDALYRHSGAADITPDDIVVTNARHYEALMNAGQTLARVIAALTPDAYP
ncbi:MAG: tRNA uridine-5-carboxymethylaminomethyl(34) synthesis GTPase MnmE, partial [Muribaculaceae bacterium]|nr:tRNA uridine-5-carboxymethylaminomethyl(34) synthesis GTPase MnmE [Muribaculaceae bacterium]